MLAEQRNGGKYPKNTKGKFDCPVPHCDRKGTNGFTTGQGVGAHMRADHPGWWVSPSGEVNGPAEPSAPSAPAAVAQDVAAVEFERETGFTDPRRHLPTEDELPPARAATVQNVATDAVVAILGIAQVRRLDAKQMRGVFDVVTTIRELDAQANGHGTNGHDPAQVPPDVPR